MAEFALGLTKTAVEGTVSRVKSAIEEQAKLKVRVQNDLVFITGEFQMMQSFLNVANKERAKNEVVRTWVRQVRDLAFDVEDCVEIVVSLDIKSGWSWLWRVLPDCMAPPRALDEAVAEIQRLKARVEDVSHRNTRYNLISDSGSGSGSSSNYNTNSKHGSVSSPATTDIFDILRGVWEAAGKLRRDLGDLKNLITNEGDDLEVISLWGVPGSAVDLGNTHFIREVYNDPEICQEFKSRAWVKVIHPFNPHEFLRSLLTQFYASSDRAKALGAKLRTIMTASEDDLMQLMQQASDEQRYLVIVEALSTVAEWDTIRMYLPDSKNGSRIVMTTQQLGLALSCIPNPYQVSVLRQFSHGQSLCAFFTKVSGRRRDMAELIWQIRRGGVISVWGDYDVTSNTLGKVFTGITHKSKVFEGVELERHNWVDIPDDQFDMSVFCRHLFFNFHSGDLRANEILKAGRLGDTRVISKCHDFREEDCLIVINGLRSINDWNLIKSSFHLSWLTKWCIIVTTNDESIARHCVDEENRALNINYLNSDSLLRHSMKSCEYYGIETGEASSRGRFFSNDRRKEARAWMDKFKFVVDPKGQYSWRLRYFLRDPGTAISLYGATAAWRSCLAREIYYEQMLLASEEDHSIFPKRDADGYAIVCLEFTKYSWVSVPQPFDLFDLCLRLFLDFHSDDLKAKQAAAFDFMEERLDPIEECFKFLRQHKCFAVIDGLQSKHDWDLIEDHLLSLRKIKSFFSRTAVKSKHDCDLIEDTLLSQPIKGCILVITQEETVAKHCVEDDENRMVSVADSDLNVASHPLIKNKRYSDRDMSRDFSSRMTEAREWTKQFELIGHESEFDLVRELLKFGEGCVISVWGIAGVGKSHLIRSIYNRNMIGLPDQLNYRRLNNVTKYSWVDVPQSVNLTELSRRILNDFHTDSLETKENVVFGMMEGQDPVQLCREFLHQETCFIVIDGLRSTDDWDLIKEAFLPEPIKGVIVVITNKESIATHCADKINEVVNVRGLEADEALNLFTKIAWGGKQLTSDMLELSRLTMTKCGGISKVIASIGDYYRYHGCDYKILDNINASFMDILENGPIFHSLRGLFSWMESYFDDCPDSLKPCIFYLSIFPSGNNIRRRRLLRRWIAEGYSRDTQGSTAEENGEQFFSKLVELCIIQQQSPRKAGVCQVNGFFREYIISRPMQDNLVFALDGHCSLNSLHVGQHLTISSTWDRAKILFESMELSRLRSFTVFGEWRSFLISDDINMRLLRVLDLEDTTDVTDSDLEHIGKLLPHLKFLSLRGCKCITCLPSSLGCLKQLQTLDIKGTSIVMLPLAIIKLQKLQYIRAGTTRYVSTSSEDHNIGSEATAPVDSDCASTSQPPVAALVAAERPVPAVVDGHGSGTSTGLLPAAATYQKSTPWRSMPPCGLAFGWRSKLHRQPIIRSSGDHCGVQFPAAAAGWIGKFTALHTLGVVNVGGPGGKTVLRELKNLDQLRRLKLSGINPTNWLDFCETISGHGYLESLSVGLSNELQDHLYCLSDISKPPKTIKTLKLHGGGNVHVSPTWMKQLDGLTKAEFEDLELIISTQEDIDNLMELKCQDGFHHLCIKPIQDGELRYGRWKQGDWVWSWSGPKFKAATVLKIDCGNYRSAIVFGPTIPKYIEVLVVQCSTTESSLEISGLKNLEKLKEVRLQGSYSDAVKQHLEREVSILPWWIKAVFKVVA